MYTPTLPVLEDSEPVAEADSYSVLTRELEPQLAMCVQQDLWLKLFFRAKEVDDGNQHYHSN